MELFHAVGGARLAVDALGVQAVHLHVLQHHLQHHGHGVLIADQTTHSHPKVLTAGIVLTLDSDRQISESVSESVSQQLKGQMSSFHRSLSCCLNSKINFVYSETEMLFAVGSKQFERTDSSKLYMFLQLV